MNINGYELVFNDSINELMNNYDNDLYAPKKEELFKSNRGALDSSTKDILKIL